MNREEPSTPCTLQVEHAGGAVRAIHVNDGGLLRSKNPREHVEEMHADIRHDASRLRNISFPTEVVPLATGCDVSEIDVRSGCRSLLIRFAQRDDDGMQPELQYGVDPYSTLALQLLERLQIPRIHDDRLFGDGRPIVANGET